MASFTLNPYYTAPGLADGDVTHTGSYNANRVEVYGRYGGTNYGGTLPASQWPDPVGSVRWYSFSIYVPPGFSMSTKVSQWFIFTQWKGLNTGSPPVAMEIEGSDFYFGGQNANVDLGPVQPGTWTHFVVGMKFSPDPTVGWATVCMNGTLLLNQAPTATMNNWTNSSGVTAVDPDYLKMGIYRSTTWNVPQTIYLTPMTIGTTFSSVA